MSVKHFEIMDPPPPVVVFVECVHAGDISLPGEYQSTHISVLWFCG